MDDILEKIAEKENKKICPVCKKVLHAGSVFDDHVKTHDEKTKIVKEDNNKKEYICQYCGRKWIGWRAYAGHIIKCKLNPERQACIEKIRKSHTGLKHSKETIEKISSRSQEYHDDIKTMAELTEEFEIFAHNERFDGKDRILYYETFDED